MLLRTHLYLYTTLFSYRRKYVNFLTEKRGVCVIVWRSIPCCSILFLLASNSLCSTYATQYTKRRAIYC